MNLRFFALLTPYCAIRLVALATAHDEGAADLIRNQFANMHSARQVAERSADAEACYDTAVRDAPGLPEPRLQRARFLRAHGRLTAARQDLLSAIGLSPAGSPGRAALERERAEIRRALDMP